MLVRPLYVGDNRSCVCRVMKRAYQRARYGGFLDVPQVERPNPAASVQGLYRLTHAYRTFHMFDLIFGDRAPF